MFELSDPIRKEEPKSKLVSKGLNAEEKPSQHIPSQS